MIIQKKRVNNIDKYIERMGNTEEFYVCVKYLGYVKWWM